MNCQKYGHQIKTGNVYEFMSFFVSCKAAAVPNAMLNQILEYLTSELDFSFCIGSESEIARKQERGACPFGSDTIRCVGLKSLIGAL